MRKISKYIQVSTSLVTAKFIWLVQRIVLAFKNNLLCFLNPLNKFGNDAERSSLVTAQFVGAIKYLAQYRSVAPTTSVIMGYGTKSKERSFGNVCRTILRCRSYAPLT